MSSNQLPSKYNPTEVENGRYQTWLEQDLFAPNNNPDAPAYSIVLPPPNVTGKLHLGHAWDTTLQDMLIRQKRMQGFEVLWLPGMDHAGIATQAKVEERLRENKITRYDLGREKFVEQVWNWKDEYASIIKQQWGKLGLSLDYSHERFTLDDGLNQAVNKVFVDLYNKDLIYRGEYIINWDPVAQTALSDIEVIYSDDPGFFYHIKYQLKDSDDFIEIATTRPETMFGDVAIAVSPKDENKKNLVGKKVIVPVVNREIPIIEDQIVDPEFGSGFVKITPAHDPNDFEAGNRHQLERINTINPDGTMNQLAGPLDGMTVIDARKKIVELLEAEGAIIKIEDYTHSVGHSERTGAVVEPRLSTQWFVKMEPLAKNALAMQASDDTKVNFWPGRFEGTFTSWMENIRDWVISRQLWWGHQIPAWYKNKDTDQEEIYVGTQQPEGEGWQRDEDVLDTWFSSALWPMSTLGWPDTEAEDFKRFYPTTTLVTGYDIIFFWVARMMFQAQEFTGTRPFENVLIHGLARDEEGRKMSKSLGNGIDPMEIIDEYGADALRWFLSTGSTPGQDIRFSYDKLKAAWNFINKIWNVSRFILMNLEDDIEVELPSNEKLALADKWILSKLNDTIENVSRNFDKFEFGESGRALYNFVWDDFADWYLEISKSSLNGDDEDTKQTVQQVLLYVLDQIMRLLHPIMPFVTEEIWQQIPGNQNQSLVTAKYPVVNEQLKDTQAQDNLQSIIELVTAVRNIRAEVGAANKTEIDLLVKITDSKLKGIFDENINLISRFTNPKTIVIDAQIDVPEQAISKVISGAEIYVPIDGLVDIEAEVSRLEAELKNFDSEVKRAEGKLNNKKFVDSAPVDVVQSERDKLADWLKKYEATKLRIDELKK